MTASQQSRPLQLPPPPQQLLLNAPQPVAVIAQTTPPSAASPPRVTATPTPTAQRSAPTATTLSAAVKADKKSCPCGRKQVNAKCKHARCKMCCAAIPELCFSEHNKAKHSYRSPPCLDLIAAAIRSRADEERKRQTILPSNEGTTLYILYMGGKQPGTVRPIIPQNWVTTNIMFCALCVHTGQLKNYKIASVIKASTEFFTEWDTAVPAVSTTVSAQ